MSHEPNLSVREMRLDEVDLRIAYFHDSSDDHLLTLGVDRTRLPSRQAWRESYEADYRRPLRARLNYSLVWELDQETVGFSSTDNIDFGVQAFLHLHILQASLRRCGLGTEFVRLSAARYFDVLTLQRLHCQPNAFNIAPNRTLQRAGFTYQFTHHTTPSEINFPQPVTRWTMQNPARDRSGPGS